MTEIDGLLKKLRLAQRQLRVIACDAAVQKVQRITATRQIELLGGGGTNMGADIATASRLRLNLV